MRNVVDMSNDPNNTCIKEDKKKPKKGTSRTAATKPVAETMFCKDCKEYKAKKCKITDTFAPRKETCKKWHR